MIQEDQEIPWVGETELSSFVAASKGQRVNPYIWKCNIKGNTLNTERIRSRIRGRKGGVLVGMLGAMLVICVLGASIIELTRDSVHSQLAANAVARAHFLAESGLGYAQLTYCSEDWPHGRVRSLSLQGGERVEILRDGGNFWAVANVDAGTVKEARARTQVPLSLCGADFQADPILEVGILADYKVKIDEDTVIEGDVVSLDDEVEIKGSVVGSVFGDKVKLKNDGTIVGDIYSSESVEVDGGLMTGDIHASNGIQIRSGDSEVNGWLFSNDTVEIEGGAEVNGSIYVCGGDVYVRGDSTVGTALDPIEIRSSGSVYVSGSAVVVGVVYAGESIEVMGGGIIEGSAYAGGSVSMGGSGSVTGDSISSASTYLEAPICPNLSILDSLSLPDATDFSAGGSDINLPKGSNNSPTYYAVSPGSYDKLKTNSKSEYTHLYFGTGNYYFEEVDLGEELSLYFNLSGSDDIRVFVEDDIKVDEELEVFVSTDGSNYYPMTSSNIDPALAARVYWESHAKFELKKESQWFGSVFTPYDDLKVKQDSLLIGSFISGDKNELKDSTVIQVGANYFNED